MIRRSWIIPCLFAYVAVIARKFVEARRMTWSQGFLGDRRNSMVTAAYDVQTLPSRWLNAPDGGILGRDRHGSATRAAVAEALGTC